MRNRKRMGALLLAVCMLLSAIPVTVLAVDGGSCGNHLRWRFDDDYTLTIYKSTPNGSGEMDDFWYSTYNDSPPWSRKMSTISPDYSGLIKKVILEEGVTSVGNDAFYSCSAIESVTVPEGLTRIGSRAFSGCIKLPQIRLPESLTTIERDAFAGCTVLEELRIPAGVTVIGSGAFSNCWKLETIILPPGITEILDETFSGCKSLTSVAIPAGVTDIGDAFGSCGKLSVIYYGGTEEMWDAITKNTNAVTDLNGVTIIYNTSIYDEGWRMHAYTDKPNLEILKGQEMAVVCQLTEGFVVSRDWDTPAWTIGSPDVISVKANGRLEDGSHCLTVTGLQSGTSTLTVTDTTTGAFVTLTITVGDLDAIPFVGTVMEVPHFYPNLIASRDVLTNFFDFNGLYVTDFPYPEDIVNTNGFYELSFTVYNEGPMHGSVDVYDANGNWYSSARIDKDSGPGSVWDVGKGTFFLIRDTFEGDVLNFTAASVSQETHITIKVPEGGYFTISNNFAESCGTFVYNTVDYCLLALETVIDASLKDSEVEQIQKLTVDKILSDPRLYQEFRNEFGEIVKMLSEYALYEGAESLTSQLAGRSFDFIQSLDIDFWSIVDSVCDITTKYGVAVLKDLLDGAGIAEVLEGLFALQKGLDYLCQTVWICTSHDETYIHLYTPEGGRGASVHGVSVDAEEGVLPADACLQVVRIGNAELLKFATTDDMLCADKYELYDISFVVDQKEIQPNGNVTVQIPIPQGMNTEDCIVLHQQPDGTWQEIDAAVKDGILEFVVNHFSLFAVVDSSTVRAATQVIRLAGANRWETAIVVADQMKQSLGTEKFDAIIIASGMNFADALAGSYLATVKDAPILLSWGQGGKYAYLDDNNVAYIKDNLSENGTVYILGSEDAVPGLYEDALSGYTIKRLGGKTRFDTNLLILREAGVKAGDEILVCTSTNFADSLSASAVGKPILLVFNEAGKLYGDQPQYLASLEGCTFTIIGGESAVCAGLEEAVSAYGTTRRLAGANRFETSVQVARTYFSHPDTAVLAYAWNYPDGLCGGPLAYGMDAPLVLTMDGYSSQAADYVGEQGIGLGYVLGTGELIADGTVYAIFAID